MSELDNVIFGLECIAGKEKWCKDCHFAQPNGSGWPNKCHKAVTNKAIELLKEQQNKIAELEEEAMVKGKPNKVINRKVLADLLVGECPLCGALFNNEICPVSCGWCGCLLDWKDGDGE